MLPASEARSADCWHIYFGDVHVGTITKSNSILNAEPKWQWLCGFYPGSEPGEQPGGTRGEFRGGPRGVRRRLAHFVGGPYRSRLSSLAGPTRLDGAEIRHAGPRRAATAAMKYAAECPFADPERAERKLMEIASIEPSAVAAVP
jgi:hypothetical protein